MGNTLGCTAGAHGNSRAWGPAQRGCPAGGATGSSTPKGAAFQSLCAALAACKRLRRASIVRRLLRSFRPLPTACALRLRAISGRGAWLRTEEYFQRPRRGRRKYSVVSPRNIPGRC